MFSFTLHKRREDAKLDDIDGFWGVLMRTKIRSKGLWPSLLFHGILISGFVYFHHEPTVLVKPPGSAKGTQLSIFYLPGVPAPHSNIRVKTHKQAVKSTPPSPSPVIEQAKPLEASTGSTASSSSHPTEEIGNNAQGDGDLNIALAQFFPYPQPDLSKLPRGASGDVILDAVIDANGKITKLTMIHGMGYGIDETVLSTVQQWTFKPANRNGTPVASEQELHFHYERV